MAGAVQRYDGVLHCLDTSDENAYRSHAAALTGGAFTGNRALLDDLQRIEQYVEMVLCYLRLDSDFTDYLFAKYDLDNIVRQAVRRFPPSSSTGRFVWNTSR